MRDVKKIERTVRVKKMNTVLKKLFPSSLIHLAHTTPWELLVAVILSAQCTDKRVNEVTPLLFKKYPTLQSYVKAKNEEIERIIFRTGFYRAKARHIKQAALALLRDHGGEVPQTMMELVALPGVGRKTANVVLSTAFNKREGIAVDTHVRRFAIRFDLTDHRDPKRIELDLMAIMPPSAWWAFNHRLVEYGRAYCPARKHDCRLHPLTKIYPAANNTWPKAH